MAIVLKDGEKLSLKSWEFNIARTLTKLAEIIKQDGGRVKPQKYAVIKDRSISSEIIDTEYKIEHLKEIEKTGEPNEKRREYIKALTANIEKLKALPVGEIVVTHTSYISFILENIYYSISINENPLFPHHIYKTPVINGYRSQDGYLEEINIGAVVDALWRRGVPDDEITQAAAILYNICKKANCTRIERDKERKRVPNIYDGGWHYETVYKPERREKLDF